MFDVYLAVGTNNSIAIRIDPFEQGGVTLSKFLKVIVRTTAAT